jgi:hypothetical protein
MAETFSAFVIYLDVAQSLPEISKVHLLEPLRSVRCKVK